MNEQIIRGLVHYEAWYNKRPMIILGQKTYEENVGKLPYENLEKLSSTIFGYKLAIGSYIYEYQVVAEEDFTYL